MEFEKVKSFLSAHVDNDGTSIYSHIAAITRKIVEEKPANAYELFENISLQIKESKLNVDSNGNGIQQIFANETEREEIQSIIDSILTLYGKKPDKKIKKDEDNEEEEEEPEAEEEDEEAIDLSKCANILENLQLFSWSGISFKYEEAYQIQNSFIKLIRKYPNIETSRFWGKIQAINNDYFIVEAKLAEYPEPDENQPPQNEDAGKGVNEYVYFVSTNIENGEWTQLSNLTPDQIKKSRQIYRLFTGDLNENVGGRVHFEWNESVLLRAQIARISASTILAPNEYYQKPEEEDEDNPFVIELNEEFTNLENDVLISNDSWVHSRGHLRLEGRIKKYIEPEKEDEDEDENEEKEEKEPTPEELEEEIAILQNIGNDQAKEFMINNGDDEEEEADDSESSNCWFFREINKNIGYQIVSINNKLWNGAKTIYLSNTKKFVNIYIGNGMKYRSEYYTPTPPSMIQPQFNEYKEVEVADPDNEEETITKQESIFCAQKEEMPPPPPPKEEEQNNEENADNDADAEEQEE